ncbi:MAG: polysaccharide deacetylase family protein [Acidiferrobacterales bacterium]|nr:polysaccharide deacetylase family protein [Acidiferrobacterales bacterium]
MSDTKLPNDYLLYQHRSYGMDHDLYDWSMLTERSKISWPNNRKLALWINVPIQFFPLDQRGDPFKVPAGMTMPYPDLRHYSLRDYGNRVGIYRLFKAFDQYGINPTFAINAQAAQRMPSLMEQIKARDNNIICHGLHMDALHHNGLTEQQEKDLIQQSLELLQEATRADIKGWLSPAKNQSSNTLELLAEAGLEFICDWVNDDMPYRFNTKRELSNMPLSTELEDYFVIQQNFHSEQSWLDQTRDACDFLIEEAKQQGGRLLALNIHPWLMGQPHRICFLEQLLEYLSNNQDIWHAGANQIHAHWLSQQNFN